MPMCFQSIFTDSRRDRTWERPKGRNGEWAGGNKEVFYTIKLLGWLPGNGRKRDQTHWPNFPPHPAEKREEKQPMNTGESEIEVFNTLILPCNLWMNPFSRFSWNTTGSELGRIIICLLLFGVFFFSSFCLTSKFCINYTLKKLKTIQFMYL